MYLDGTPAATRVLNEGWTLTWDGAHQPLPARVPGYAQHDLFDAGLLPDPFFRDNEHLWQPWCDRDYTYTCSFDTDEALRSCATIELVFDGIDTVADVWLNDQNILSADNMYRTWRVAVQELLRPAGNTLRVELHSPVRVCAEREARYKDSSPVLSVPLDQRRHLRKMPCSFGWDWGIKLPLSGIWKAVRLEGYATARIAELWHATVKADAQQARIEGGVRIVRAAACACEVLITVTAPDGAMHQQTLALPDGPDSAAFACDVALPALWWPNGMGAQPLYTIEATLMHNGAAVSVCRRRIGIRTIELVQEPDAFGQSFFFRVNGAPLFAKGANWIPADAMPSRITADDYQRLLTAARDAHMNLIRVWGGGMYEDDAFYDTCDELGLLVWQDFMSACTLMPTYRAFLDAFGAEARDALGRLRHHACIALWCGNNECEEVLIWRKLGDQHRREYDFLYDQYLRGVVHSMDPARPYWPSSPHSPRSLNPHRQDCGDTHYWGVWHGDQPFEAYLARTDRFMSEFGFQAFPDLHTVTTYAAPEDFTLESPVMNFHQRSGEKGNARMKTTMQDRYGLPAQFADQLIVSQIAQADAVRLGVEHWRRHRHARQCMGALYWQLNDNWPVASWASIDYHGRWKALHYAAREFFAPLLISPHVEDGCVTVTLVNDTFAAVRGSVRWTVRTYAGRIVNTGTVRGVVAGGDSARVMRMPLDELLKGCDPSACYVLCDWRGKQQAARRVLHLSSLATAQLCDPALTIERDGSVLRVRAKRFAAHVCVACDDARLQPSDNFFDLLPRETLALRLLPVRAALDDEQIAVAAVHVRSIWEMCRTHDA